MTVQEIIAKIEALPAEEQAAVFDYLRKICAGSGAPADRQGVNPVIANESAENIFQKHDNLFRNLSK